MRLRLRFFRFCIVGLILGLLALLVVFVSDFHVKHTTASSHSNDLTEIPTFQTALIPGCSKTLRNGRANLYFTYRIDAAVQLYEAGICETFIVSGDNHREEYDEPSLMKEALIERGISPDRIFCDYAGFRTLDSIVRANRIFGRNQILVVSQKFHNERALYIAEEHGIEAFGYNAQDVNRLGGLKTQLREKLARVKTILDLHILHAQPRFGGPPVPIPDYS